MVNALEHSTNNAGPTSACWRDSSSVDASGSSWSGENEGDGASHLRPPQYQGDVHQYASLVAADGGPVLAQESERELNEAADDEANGVIANSNAEIDAMTAESGATEDSVRDSVEDASPEHMAQHLARLFPEIVKHARAQAEYYSDKSDNLTISLREHGDVSRDLSKSSLGKRSTAAKINSSAEQIKRNELQAVKEAQKEALECLGFSDSQIKAHLDAGLAGQMEQALADRMKKVQPDESDKQGMSKRQRSEEEIAEENGDETLWAWFLMHFNKPYPSERQANELARATGRTREQERFANLIAASSRIGSGTD